MVALSRARCVATKPAALPDEPVSSSAGGEEDLIKRWSNHSPNLFIIRLFSRRPLYCASPTHFIISSPLRDFFSSSARAPLSLLFLPLPFPPLLVGVITLRLSSRLVAPTPLSLSLFSVRGSRSLCASGSRSLLFMILVAEGCVSNDLDDGWTDELAEDGVSFP